MGGNLHKVKSEFIGRTRAVRPRNFTFRIDKTKTALGDPKLFIDAYYCLFISRTLRVNSSSLSAKLYGSYSPYADGRLIVTS
jgi:hypothetical protein